MPSTKKKQAASTETDPIELIVQKFEKKTKAAEAVIRSNEKLLELFADKEMPPEVALSLDTVTKWAEKRTTQALYNQLSGAALGTINELLY